MVPSNVSGNSGAAQSTNDDLSQKVGPRRTQLFVTRNDLAPLVAWLFFLYGLLRHAVRSPAVQFIAFAAVVLAACLLTLATHSRLVAAITVVGLILFAPASLRSNRLWVLGALALGAVLVLDHRNLEHLVQRTLLTQGGKESLLARLSLWIGGVTMAMDAPWIGHGLGSFGHAYDAYRQAGAPWATADLRLTPWPHNVFIEALFDKGVVGLAALAMLFAWSAWNLWHEPPKELAEVRRPVAFLFLAMTIIGLVDSTTIRLWYLPSLLFVLGMSSSLRTGPNSGNES